MRKYQPIWEAVKNSNLKSVSLAAELSKHRRIIKAVIKEKSQDLGWKQTQLELGKKYTLLYEIDGKCIRFYLEDTSYQLPVDIHTL